MSICVSRMLKKKRSWTEKQMGRGVSVNRGLNGAIKARLAKTPGDSDE